jgi:hypothetical protein
MSIGLVRGERELTIQSDGAVCLATRVFGHAFVYAVVAVLHVANGESHYGLVRRFTGNGFSPVMEMT